MAMARLLNVSSMLNVSAMIFIASHTFFAQGLCVDLFANLAMPSAENLPAVLTPKQESHLSQLENEVTKDLPDSAPLEAKQDLEARRVAVNLYRKMEHYQRIINFLMK